MMWPKPRSALRRRPPGDRPWVLSTNSRMGAACYSCICVLSPRPGGLLPSQPVARLSNDGGASFKAMLTTAKWRGTAVKDRKMHPHHDNWMLMLAKRPDCRCGWAGGSGPRMPVRVGLRAAGGGAVRPMHALKGKEGGDMLNGVCRCLPDMLIAVSRCVPALPLDHQPPAGRQAARWNAHTTSCCTRWGFQGLGLRALALFVQGHGCMCVCVEGGPRGRMHACMRSLITCMYRSTNVPAPFIHTRCA